MLLTDAVFQPPMFWLNAAAPRNMKPMSLTFAVFQPPRFWLNAAALENM